jgi:rhamnulokinase
MPRTTLAAIDLGATSGRVIVGVYSDKGLELTEAHRFPNEFHSLNGYQYWELGRLSDQVSAGLVKAKELFPDLSCCGVDTWGVDVVLTNNDGRLAFPCHAYRDERTNATVEALEAAGDTRMLYDKTGMPPVNYNTGFQLAETLKAFPGITKVADRAMLLPHFINYLLSGIICSDYSQASTTQLMEVHGLGYDRSVLDYFGIPHSWLAAPESAGRILGPVRNIAGLEKVNLALVPGHDTSCAFEAIPREGNSLIISSGTWMLVGALTEKPFVGDAAFKIGISNERTGTGGYRPNKSMLGMWLLEQTIPFFDKRPTTNAEWSALISAAEECVAPPVLLNLNDKSLFNPSNMREAIDKQLSANGGKPPEDLPGYLRLVCASLGAGVQQTALQFENIMGSPFENIVIVGGGSKNRLLCQMIANATGKTVTSFNLEATSVGNIGYQLLAMEKIPSLETFHSTLRPTLSPQIYSPS